MYILILILLISKTFQEYNLKDFTSRFYSSGIKESKFYKLKDNTIESELNSQIIMTYFLTEDLMTNILTMNENRNIIYSKNFNKEKHIYKEGYIFDIKRINKDEKIKSINLWFSKDNIIYFFLITEDNKNLKLNLLKYNNKNGFEYIKNNKLEKLKFTNQPILFQKNKFSNKSYEYEINFIIFNGKERVLYSFNENLEIKNLKFENIIDTNNKDNCMENPNHPINFHHGSSFLDLDGDCQSDLIINSYENNKGILEIYLSKGNKFCLVKKIEYNLEDFSLPNYKDISRDGLVDIIFIDIKENSLKILYNKIEKKKITLENNELCTVNKEYKSPFNDLKDYDYKFEFDKSTIAKKESYYGLPIIPRLGDLFLNGFIDLVVNLYSDKENDFITIVYQGTFNTENKKLSFKPIKNELGFQTTLFDYAETGRLGLLINYKQDKKFKIMSYYNYLNKKNYYLKSLSFNKKNLNNFILGANYKFKKIDNDNSFYIMSNTQNKSLHSNYLDPIYCHFGIGKTNKYIKYFKIGLNLEGDEKKIETWDTIIPNSQTILYLNSEYGYTWNLEVVIDPTEATLFIIFSTVIILLILGAIILFLHLKEKKEEMKNNSEILPYL